MSSSGLTGCMPRPRNAMPSSLPMAESSRTWVASSSRVLCRVRYGSPPRQRDPAVSGVDRELLVLGADRPALARLGRAVKLLDQLIDALDGRRLAARAEV